MVPRRFELDLEDLESYLWKKLLAKVVMDASDIL